MATVTEVVEIWRGVGGRYAGPTEMNYVRRFRVTTDEPTSDPDDFLGDPGIPALDSDLKCGRRVVGYNFDRSYDTPKVWFVEVEYSDRNREVRKMNYNPDPTLRPLVVEMIPSERQKAIEKEPEPSNVAIVNSAGDPFERGVLVDDARLVFRCRKNIASPYPETGSELFIDEVPKLANNNCTNSDRIAFKGFIFSPNQVLYKFRGFSELKEEACVEFVEWTYELHVATAGDEFSWTRRLLNAGYNQKDRTGEKNRIVLSDGRHPTVPQLLSAGGVWLGAEADRTDATYSDFNVYRQEPFADFLPEVTDAS